MPRLASRLLLFLSSVVAAGVIASCGVNPMPGRQVSGDVQNPPNPAKATPVITWPQPAPITNPTPLGATQLGASASVAGSFAYSPTAGTVLPAGTQTLSTTFTPNDTADYNTATASVKIIVNPGLPTASNCSGARFTGGSTFIYVTSAQSPPGGPYQVNAFSAAPDGSLTPIPESPLTLPGIPGVGTGSLVFGDDGYQIYSFLLHSDGCLSVENSLVAGQEVNGKPYIGPNALFLDPKEADLYSFDYVPPDGFSTFSSFSFNANNGQVAKTGDDVGDAGNSAMLAFASNDKYAFTSYCYFRGGEVISEYQRNSAGVLTSYNGHGTFPGAQSGNYYCPWGAAADNENHIIVAVQSYPTGGPPSSPNGPWQLAVYTIDDAGNMNTASTWQNMATPDIPDENFIGVFSFSPDSRYFALSSFMALEVFSWDAATGTLTPIVTINNTEGSCQFPPHATDGCTGSGFGAIEWGSNDHLYITLGRQLFVYSVTDSGITPAPGSPYTFQAIPWVTVISPRS